MTGKIEPGLLRYGMIPVIDKIKKINPIIYIIDPDEGQRSELEMLLKRTGYDAVCYPSAEIFLEAEQCSERFGCVISEMVLPGVDGLELLSILRERNSHLPLIILTGDHDVGHAVTALHRKASDYLVKPVIERELIKRIKITLQEARNMYQAAHITR
ncbi:MAG: response regulator [Gammaproteobacteria bacterium]|nr:response regulator [Gammaproteobacteria bacterium]MDP7419411.1 response regulator [Gammaproteobacteria bacterium]MDP7660077.1 response regulator [Gammaproteobacteria bacterium]HJP37812.1 response regulator [Gammaproteobacteria bacterium]